MLCCMVLCGVLRITVSEISSTDFLTTSPLRGNSCCCCWGRSAKEFHWWVGGRARNGSRQPQARRYWHHWCQSWWWGPVGGLSAGSVIFVRFVIFETSAKFCISTAVANAAFQWTSSRFILLWNWRFSWQCKAVLFLPHLQVFRVLSTAWVDENIE